MNEMFASYFSAKVRAGPAQLGSKSLTLDSYLWRKVNCKLQYDHMNLC